MTLRRASAFAVALSAAFGLAQPALAGAARAAVAQSTSLAGFDFANYIAVPGAVSAVVVVPKLDCKATPPAGTSVDVGVGIQSVSSYARLTLSCTSAGVARYFPSLVVNGTTKNLAGDAAQAGDRVQFAVSQSASQVTVSVVDLNRKFIATSNGSGSSTGEGVEAGAFPGVSGSTTAGLPDFGTVAFSDALINGLPFGSAGTSLQVDDLASSAGALEVKTTFSASNKESFDTVFERS